LTGRDGHSSGTPVARRLARPTRAAARKPAWEKAVAGRSPVPPLFGLAPGGVCRAVRVAAAAVRSYRTVSPLPAASDFSRERRRSVLCGTVPGVAPAGRYPAPCFHGARTFLPRPPRGSRERPSGRLARVEISLAGRGVNPARPIVPGAGNGDGRKAERSPFARAAPERSRSQRPPCAPAQRAIV
jgi:hypothetical protein